MDNNITNHQHSSSQSFGRGCWTEWEGKAEEVKTAGVSLIQSRHQSNL